MQRLNHFQFSCLKKRLKIKSQDKILNTEVMKKAWMHRIHAITCDLNACTTEMDWPCYKNVIRMLDGRPTKRRITGAKAPSDDQKKRYKDTFKAALKDFNIPIESFEQADQDPSIKVALSHQSSSL